MKRVLSLALLSCLFLAVSCTPDDKPNEDNNWTGDNLRGKVKTIVERGFQARKQGEEWIKGVPNQTYTIRNYNAQGFKISERKHYTDSNELQSGFDYVYDEENNIMRINAIDPVGNIAAYSLIDELEGKTGIQKYTDHFGSTKLNSMPTGYTEMDWKDYRLMESRAYHLTGDMTTRVVYEYNKHGDVTKFALENKAPNQRDMTVNSFYLASDETGNWTQQAKEYVGFPLKEMIEREYTYFEE